MLHLIKNIVYGIGGIFAVLVMVGSLIGGEAGEMERGEVDLAPAAPGLQGGESTQTEMEVAASAIVPAATSTLATPSASAEASYYSVVRVIDGDTLAVNIDGTTETIRLIGIDTPETVDPRTTVECFGAEASAVAKQLLTGARVRILTDDGQGLRDKYNRMLAYVYLEDGTFVNLHLIAEGYAHEYTYSTPYKYQAEFKAAQVSARLEEKGLWAPDVCAESDAPTAPAPTPAPPTPTRATQDTSSYSCSANTYNCGDFATHAEAQSVYEACGGVDRDIHALDADKDGLACETLP